MAIPRENCSLAGRTGGDSLPVLSAHSVPFHLSKMVTAQEVEAAIAGALPGAQVVIRDVSGGWVLVLRGTQ